MFIENEELVERNERDISYLPLCALVAPISQVVQTIKAVSGVVYPGAYYQHDPFIEIFANLAKVACDVGCSTELIGCFGIGSDLIHEKLYLVSNRDYYLALFIRDFQFISQQMQIDDMTKERKQLLLNMLDPLHSKSGMTGCAPALARILEQICSHMKVSCAPSEGFHMY